MERLAMLLFSFGGNEILLIAIAILLLFGGRKIPELMRGLGSGIKEFKNAAKEEEKSESKNKTNEVK